MAAYTSALQRLENPVQLLIVAKTYYNLKSLNMQLEDINCIFKD